MLKRLYQFFTSVKLAIVLLALGLLIVFFGTLAQGFFGLYTAQTRYFQCLVIDLQAMYVAFHKLVDMLTQGFGYPLAPLERETVLSVPRIPIFPGGYLVGGFLVLNLFAAHLKYYRPGVKRFGIALIHLGVVLLLLGQFATDLFSRESFMRIRENSSSNFSESNSKWELAVVDTSDAKEDKVVVIPERIVAQGGELAHPSLPFKLRVKTFYRNSDLTDTNSPGYELVQAETVAPYDIWWKQLPPVTEMDNRDVPSGLLELTGGAGQAREIFVSGRFQRNYDSIPLPLKIGDRTFQISLRPTRFYKPFSLYLLDFRYDRYAGTETAKNFSSRVRLQRPATGENREVTIRMNEPLRYAGETFFQADWDKRDERGTVLQVVHNPGWLTPYFGCLIVAGGMIWQFLVHLIGFARKSKFV